MYANYKNSLIHAKTLSSYSTCLNQWVTMTFVEDVIQFNFNYFSYYINKSGFLNIGYILMTPQKPIIIMYFTLSSLNSVLY